MSQEANPIDNSSLPVPPPISTEGSSIDAPAAARLAFPAALPPRLPRILEGGPHGGGGLGAKALERKNPVAFTEHALQSHAALGSSRSPTDRLRELDAFRLHSTLPEERDRVGIPSSYERIDVTNLTHLMALCGGFVGVRFSSEVIHQLSKFKLFYCQSFIYVYICLSFIIGPNAATRIDQAAAQLISVPRGRLQAADSRPEEA
jgi:hypothetical protein